MTVSTDPPLIGSIEDAMTATSLVQYFRSFLIKLNMIECQLGQMNLGGTCALVLHLELISAAFITCV